MAAFRVIDADGHVMEPDDAWPHYLDASMQAMAPRRVVDNQGHFRHVIGGNMLPRVPFGPDWPMPREGGFDPKARLVDMDAEGMESAILFPTTGLYFAGLRDARVQAALCRAYNDWLHDFCATDRARLLPAAVVPQNDVAELLAEARRAIDELGCRAVMLRPNPIAGRHLDDRAYDPLWSLLEERAVPAAIHEGTTQDLPQSGDRFDNYTYRHMCSHPHEQQMALLALVCGGVLERHPGLRVAFLESGCGWIGHWLDRMDEHMGAWGHATLPLPLKPSEYFLRQGFVSAEPDERTLPGMVAAIGDDNILFASDYPHPDGVFPGVVAEVAEREELSESTRAKILATNAARCFGL